MWLTIYLIPAALMAGVILGGQFGPLHRLPLLGWLASLFAGMVWPITLSLIVWVEFIDWRDNKDL